MRVHEVAASLGVTSKELIDQLRAEGEWVASHLSVVPAPVVRRYLPQPPPQPDPQMPGSGARATEYPIDWTSRPMFAPAIRPLLRRRPGPRPITLREYVRDPYDDYCDDDTLRYQPTLTTRDVADLLGVTMAAVRQWVARGHLSPSGQLGAAHTFSRADVDRAREQIRARHRATALRPPSLTGWSEPRPFDRVPWKYRDKAVTVDEAATLTGVSPSTVRSWIHRGHLQPLPSSGDRRTHLRLEEVIKVAGERTLPLRGGRRTQPKA